MLEEKNTSYMEKSVEWEEESKKTSALKSQVEVYKRQVSCHTFSYLVKHTTVDWTKANSVCVDIPQVQELQTRVTNETKRADKSDYEIKRSQDKVVSLQKEKERLAVDLQALRESNEELQYSKLADAASEASGGKRRQPLCYPMAHLFQ